MKRNILFGALAAAAMFAGFPADAGTVMWYRFGELGSDGTRATADTVIANYASPGSLDGRACSYSGTTLAADPNLMPYGVSTMPGDCVLSASGMDTRTVDGAGMHFGAASIEGSSSNGAGSAVVCDFDEGLRLQELTVEAFFRVPANIAQWTMAPIAIMKRNASEATWSVQLYQGKVFVRLTTSDGSVRAAWPSASSTSINDGKWHHVALTIGGSPSRKATVFLDYKQEGSISDVGQLDYKGEGYPLLIGCNDLVENRTFPGDIDELRLSDTVLSVDEMLHVRSVVETGADTLVYMPFDTEYVHDFGWPQYNFAISNDYPVSLKVDAKLPPKSLKIGAVGGAPVATYLYEGVRGPVRHEDVGVYCCETNSRSATADAGGCFAISDPALKIPASSFTLETFVKFRAPLECSDWSKDMQFIFNSPAFMVFVHAQTHFLYLRTIDESGTSRDVQVNSDGAPYVDDGGWHHVALVYDADGDVCSAYVDYRHHADCTSVVLKHDTAEASKICIGAMDTSFRTLDGWLDDVRLTARALAPEEFLTSTHSDMADHVVAWYDFEGDMTVKPLGAPYQLPGVLGAFIDGGSAVITDETWGGWRSLTVNGERVRRSNVGSLHLDGGKAVYLRNRLIELETATVELFVKPERLVGDNGGAWASVVGLHRGPAPAGASTQNKPVWELRYRTGGVPQLYTMVAETEYDANYPNDGTDYVDGKWHHVAFSYTPSSDGTKTDVKLYWDYELMSSQQLNTRLEMPTSDSYFEVGCGVVPGRTMVGNIDEIRIHEVVLSPEMFLRRGPAYGFSVFVR